MKRAYYDLHCHVLPGMDDGCKDVQTSLNLVAMQIKAGCRGIVATSHYYPQESIKSFFIRRYKAHKTLRTALDKLGASSFPIALGAEVAYQPHLVTDPHLKALCFGKSNLMLLEMPFEPWHPSVLDDVDTLINQRGITPIIAHIERFFDYTDKKSIEALIEKDVIVQMNTGHLLSDKRDALKLVKHGVIDVLGTDAHNVGSRKPNFDAGLDVLSKKHQDEAMKRMLANNAAIFRRAIAE